MSEFNVILELPIRNHTADQAGELMDAYAEFHPAIATSPFGWSEVTITVTAESMRQAIATALALSGPIVSVTAMTTEEYDRRPVPTEQIPELLSVTEMAEQLGITRQAVLQKIEAGQIPARKVGSSWVVPHQGTVSASWSFGAKAEGRAP